MNFISLSLVCFSLFWDGIDFNTCINELLNDSYPGNSKIIQNLLITLNCENSDY